MQQIRNIVGYFAFSRSLTCSQRLLNCFTFQSMYYKLPGEGNSTGHSY
jgi:hypothetical protein